VRRPLIRYEDDLEKLLQERVHPDYRRDPKIRGNRTQYLRETPDGLFLSYNVARRRNGLHRMGYAVLLAPHEPTPHSPLALGSWFDTYRGLDGQWCRHLGRPIETYPRGLWSTGDPTPEMLVKMADLVDYPERVFLPFYRSVLVAGRPRVLRLLRCAISIFDRLRAKGLARTSSRTWLARALGIEEDVLDAYRQLATIDGFDVARGKDIVVYTEEGREDLHTDQVPDKLIVLHHLRAFRTARVPLATVVQRLTALKAVENDSVNAPPIG
jgi:hypothetical protein